jgi:tetratricopeptide (TPR) repeat protein
MSGYFTKRNLLVLAAGVVISSLPMIGQNRQTGPTQPAPGGNPGTTTPGGVGNPNTPGRTTPFPDTRGQQPQPGDPRSRFPETRRPIFLSGKVVMDDGTPPPDSVTIERVCNGNHRPEAYTDSKGRFSFQLGQNAGVMQDASVSSASDPNFGSTGGFGTQGGVPGDPRGGGISERDLMGCEIRATLAGYRSETVSLSGRRMFDNPDVGTIILHRLANVEGTTISMTSLQAPKDAKKAYDKSKDLLKKNKLPEAQKELEKAVGIYPKYATAWYELGRIHQQEKRIEEARKAYSEALSADSKFVSPYVQLALLAAAESKWQEVADTTDRVLKLNPMDLPQAYFYNSVANYNLKKFDLAEKSAREAEKLDSQHQFPRVNHLLGVILAEKQDYAGAADQMRNYLKFAPNSQDAETVKKQLTELEKLTSGPTAKKIE